MKVTLKDGSFKEYDQAMSVYDIAKDISEGLARVATAGEVDGEIVDLRTVVVAEGKIKKDKHESVIFRRDNSHYEMCIRDRDLAAAQPFFSKLQLDVVASEPNELLNSREDLFSTLDGLHEDMYFAGTDYFKNFGIEKSGVITDAPVAYTHLDVYKRQLETIELFVLSRRKFYDLLKHNKLSLIHI